MQPTRHHVSGPFWDILRLCQLIAASRRPLQQLPASIRPNNRETVAGSDCLWHSCTEHKRCHISLEVTRQQQQHSLIPLRYPQLNQYRRQLLLQSPHVPPQIQVQHLPGRPERCQRQRYQPQRRWPPVRGIGTLSLVERKSGSTDRLPGKIHKSCADRAWPQTMGRLDRYRRIPHT
jgi:hypothetical protein